MTPNSISVRQDPTASTAIVDNIRTLGLFKLTILGLVLGIVTGIGAVLFRDLINLLHNLFFTGHLARAYDANVFTPPSRWGAFVILAPVLGGVIVTFLVSNFTPEAKGHGVPEVMEAIYYKRVIRPIVALVKSLASAFGIGSGSSVGREGPIIQIGSAIGSTLGQIVAMATGQRITLVAAGAWAGAGIAATFNTTIGGVMFAIELMLPEVSVDTFLPVAVATGAATFLGRWFFGDQPAFQAPTTVAMTPHANKVSLLILYTVLGGLVGVAAAGFVRGIHIVEDVFDRIPWRYARHMVGMLLVGLLMYALFRTLSQYYVDGVGYSTIRGILVGDTSAAFLLGLLTKEGRLFGVIRINADLWRGLAGVDIPVTLGDLASRDFAVARQDAIAFDVIDRMWRKRAFMAVVVKGRGIPRGDEVVGVITKEHVADSVASSMKIYPN